VAWCVVKYRIRFTARYLVKHRERLYPSKVMFKHMCVKLDS